MHIWGGLGKGIFCNFNEIEPIDVKKPRAACSRPAARSRPRHAFHLAVAVLPWGRERCGRLHAVFARRNAQRPRALAGDMLARKLAVFTAALSAALANTGCKSAVRAGATARFTLAATRDAGGRSRLAHACKLAVSTGGGAVGAARHGLRGAPPPRRGARSFLAGGGAALNKPAVPGGGRFGGRGEHPGRQKDHVCKRVVRGGALWTLPDNPSKAMYISPFYQIPLQRVTAERRGLPASIWIFKVVNVSCLSSITNTSLASS